MSENSIETLTNQVESEANLPEGIAIKAAKKKKAKTSAKKIALPEPLPISTDQFLQAFRTTPNELVCVRVLPAKFPNLPKPTEEQLTEHANHKTPYFAWQQATVAPWGINSRPDKQALPRRLFADDKNKTVGKLHATNAGAEARGVYFVVNKGGHKKEEITQPTAFFFEIDDKPLEEQWKLALALPVRPHIIVKTRNSLHCYWVCAEGVSLEEWDTAQRTLIVALNSDKTIKDRSRVMRLPGFHHTTFDYATGETTRVPVEVLKFDPDQKITAADMLKWLGERGTPAITAKAFDERLKAQAAERAPREPQADRSRLFEMPPQDLREVHSAICVQLDSVQLSEGETLRAVCPSCADANPSFVLTLAPDKILMYCHAGCAFDDLCARLGLAPKDLFAPKTKEEKAAEVKAYREQKAAEAKAARERKVAENKAEKERKAAENKAEKERKAAENAAEKKQKAAEEADAPGKISQATRLVDLVESLDIKLFFEPSEEKAYASFLIDGHLETHRLHGKSFRNWLRREYHEEHGVAINSQAFQDALGVLDGLAEFEAAERRAVALRLVRHGEAIYWDTCNDQWQQIRITAEGVEMVEAANSPVRFRRAKGMLAIPAPVKGGSFGALQQLMNLPDKQTLTLLEGSAVGAMIPDLPAFPITAFSGEQGSGKSTTTEMYVSLIDPSQKILRAMPRDEEDLVIAAQFSHMLTFDNVSELPKSMFDALCRASTGGVLARREKYKDDEESVFMIRRPVALNGIPDVLLAADAVDRGIFHRLPPIPEDDYRPKETIWNEFNEERARLAGALCDAVSRALRVKPTLGKQTLTRMADFTLIAIAAEEPEHKGEFIAAYRSNRVKANEAALAANQLAAYVIKWFGDDGYDDPIELEKLLLQLNVLYEDDHKKANQKVFYPEKWPKTPQQLGNELRRCSPNLRRVGIEITDPGLDVRTRKARRFFKRIEEEKEKEKNVNQNKEFEQPSKPSKPSTPPVNDDSEELNLSKACRRLGNEAFEAFDFCETAEAEKSKAFEGLETKPSTCLRQLKPSEYNGLEESSKASKASKASQTSYSDSEKISEKISELDGAGDEAPGAFEETMSFFDNPEEF